MRFRRIAALVATATAASAACSGGSGGTQPSAVQTSSAPRLTAPAVSMTIADGATLVRAVPWRVTAKTTTDDVVSQVDFLVDGKTMWTENESPYVFGEDDQVLPPWLLGAGSHLLAAHVTTAKGATADSTAHVTVRANLAGNDRIAGTYSRVVTRADQQRTKPYRLASKGAFGELSPTGRWTLHIKKNGEIVGVDPTGDRSTAFVQPYTVTGSTVTLYGPAVWRQGDPGTPSRFCEPEGPSDYTWSLAGSSLTITNKQKSCADRDTVFVGTWQRR